MSSKTEDLKKRAHSELEGDTSTDQDISRPADSEPVEETVQQLRKQVKELKDAWKEEFEEKLIAKLEEDWEAELKEDLKAEFIKQKDEKLKKQANEIEALKAENENLKAELEELKSQTKFKGVALSPESQAIIQSVKGSQTLLFTETGYPGILSDMNAAEIVNWKTKVVYDMDDVVIKQPKTEYLPHILSFYYICPLKVDGPHRNIFMLHDPDANTWVSVEEESREMPTDTKLLCVSFFYDISPQFQKLNPGFLRSTLDMLDDSFKNTITYKNVRECCRKLRDGLEIDPNVQSFYSSADIRYLVLKILEANSKVLSILGLSFVCRLKKVYRQASPEFDVEVEITATVNHKPLLLFETKHRRLDEFVNEDGTLKREDPSFVRIMKQCTVSMKLARLPHIFLTDFTTTIFISVSTDGEVNERSGNTEKKVGSSQDHQRLGFTYTYCVIRSSDTPVTLQAVLSSVLLHQFAIGVMKKDFEETETLKPCLAKYSGFTRECLEKQNVMLSLLDRIQKPASVVREDEIKFANERLEALQQHMTTLRTQ